MKRFLTIFAALCICTMAASTAMAGGLAYGWTVSNSTTDPFSYFGAPSAGQLRLWFACSVGDGMSAAELDIRATPANSVGTVTAVAPYLVVYDPDTDRNNILLACPCTNAPARAANLNTHPDDDPQPDIVSVCIVSATTVNCPADQDVPSDRHGYNDNGLSPCPEDTPGLCAGPTSVEESSWGTIKSLYR
jgi:hypothetical protein